MSGTLVDLQLSYGTDIALAPNGDLLTDTGTQMTAERVMRRLMTATNSYLWFPNYGAGLPTMVGQVTRISKIQSIIRRQMLREQSVAQTPPPSIQVTSDNNGYVYAYIQYVDANTGETQILNLPGDTLP